MKNIILTLILLLGGLAVWAENVVSVSSASGHPLDELTLHVSLVNTEAVVALQAEIPLGSQLTYVAGSVALNTARITDHQVSAAVVNGTLKIFAYSLSLAPFVGNSGTLLSFTLKLKNEPGDYALEMSNTILSDASGTALSVSTQNGTVTILSPKLQINTPTIDYGHVPIWSEYTQYAQLSNVGNEPLTISSITFSDAVFSCPTFATTTLQAGQSTSFNFKFAPMLKGAVNATATIVSNSISGNGIVNLVADPFAVNEIHIGNTLGYCDSIVELPISMNNMEGIIGLQIEANLDEALEYVDFTLSSRKTDHVATGVLVGNLLRLMAYSPSGALFTGDDGVIGTVRFLLHGHYGNYYLNPSKAVLADANGEDVLSDAYNGYVTVRSPQISGNDALDFGSSSVTETVNREYTVYNWGNASMRIDQVVFDQQGFAVAETMPITVDEWGSATLHVSYSREQAGDFNALMKIYSNDPQNGLKNVALSGHRYEPNSLELAVGQLASSEDDVEIAVTLHNYSAIVALQADFRYPYQDYAVASTDFQLTDRFASHQLFAMPVNDSTYRILVLSMQNAAVAGNDGVALNVTMHPTGTPSAEEYTVSLSNIVLSDNAGVNLFTGEDAMVAFSFFITQSTHFNNGWTWWSTYIEQPESNGLTQLENGLGNNGLIIKKQTASLTNVGGDWYGTLYALDNASSYRIKTNAEVDVDITGPAVATASHPVTLLPNWTWIGYPCAAAMSIDEAMSGITPTDMDVLKTQSGSATYMFGGWYGALGTLTPGMGLMYKSNSSENITLTFPSGGAKGELRPNLTAENNHWQPNLSAYPDNMTVIAVVEIDEEPKVPEPVEGPTQELGENYELAAFANGECRGSVRLLYVEPLNRYVAFLTVAGDEIAELRFGLYNTETGEEYHNAEETLTYESNAVVGSLDAPYVIRFRSNTGLDDLNNRIQVFPNPVGKGQTFNIGMTNGEISEAQVEIINALGVVVETRRATSLQHGTVKAPNMPGVYTLRITMEGKGTCYRKLVVK